MKTIMRTKVPVKLEGVAAVYAAGTAVQVTSRSGVMAVVKLPGERSIHMRIGTELEETEVIEPLLPA